MSPDLAGGFRDYGPTEMIAKQAILDTARRAFERFGFDPLETAAIQRTDVLTGGEADSQKIIFNVRGSKEKTSDLSLRFDLTVPLARFIAANPETPKPFKRYEIGRVWRGESPQAGRYREFLQADIDIVGSSSPAADAEIIALMDRALTDIGIEKFIIKINSRAILNALPKRAGFPDKDLWTALRIVDKMEKTGGKEVQRELAKAFNPSIASHIIEFFETLREPEKNKSFRGVKDVENIIQSAVRLGANKNRIIFDPTIVRGLSYYTGAVFETVLPDLPEIGSVFSGGRYDDLVMSFTGQRIPAVGSSLGVDRLFAALEKLGKIKPETSRAQVLILDLSPALMNEYFEFARLLRDAGINTVLSLGGRQTFQAQLGYALKRGIPFALVYGDDEKKKNTVAIKNLVKREQKEIPKDKLIEYFKK